MQLKRGNDEVRNRKIEQFAEITTNSWVEVKQGRVIKKFNIWRKWDSKKKDWINEWENDKRYRKIEEFLGTACDANDYFCLNWSPTIQALLVRGEY